MAVLRVLLLVCSSLAAVVLSEPMCEDINLAACRKAGYKQTARFPLVNGRPYDKVEAANALDFFVSFLQQCSPYASTILCSMYLPKCTEGIDRPIPPCRSVCQSFVHDCKSTIRRAAVGGLLTSLCELLPNNASDGACFNPPGFRPKGGISPVDGCHDLTIKSCADNLHYKTTFLTKDDQKESNSTILQPIIDSKCSPHIEKYLCFLRFPNCTQHGHGINIPCRSLCEQVRKTCQGEFLKLGFAFPPCGFILPDDSSNTGLCLVKQWPAPWPKEFRPVLPDLKCVPITVKSCSQMEYYTKTANYPAVNGRPFQSVKGELLDFYIQIMDGCSPYLELIMCSLYLPKCEDCVPRPILPCRRVCQKFVKDCQKLLRLASVGGMFTALCDLLPVYNRALPQSCILPKDFEDSSSEGSPRNFCHKLESNSCKNDLHYNSTFLLRQDQVDSSVSLLQPIVDSKCSVDAEKFLCFARVPPCSPEGASVAHLPCKSLCDKVVKECGGEFDKIGIRHPYCNATYPDDVSPTGMCELRTWPAPWPWAVPPPGERTCEPLRARSCANAGYKFTAKFPPKNGKCYQDMMEEDLRFYNSQLQNCSAYSSVILCSLHLPKCVEGKDRPIPPCRSVCLSFVHDCLRRLRLASVGGMFTALCDILPEDNSTPGECFVPDGYKRPTASPTGPSTDFCHPVESTKCKKDLHYNRTFVEKPDQVDSDLTIFQSLIDSKCSPDIQKFLCFSRLPPCNPNDKAAYLPCRSLCEKIHKECDKQIKAGFKLPRCDLIFPEGTDPRGLCPVRAWPAPWPRRGPPASSSTSGPPSIGGTSKSKKSKSKAGLIAGVVVTVLVVIGAAVLGFLYYRRSQRVKQFAAQHFVNVQEPIVT